ncbi:MAG TPA: hypothetical protein VGS27_15075 [Candidatus Sulfotelmatobacter sp.]|nr:hypothetical protein [Candidatus Sulfotelmatobacter sp.]
MDNTRIVILTKLEASLKNSLKALLARDAVGLDLATGEQSLLAGELSRMHSTHTPWAEVRNEAGPLRSAAKTVLSLARVQSVVLRRQQQRLKTLWRLSDGGRLYGPQIGGCEADGRISYSEKG